MIIGDSTLVIGRVAIIVRQVRSLEKAGVLEEPRAIIWQASLEEEWECNSTAFGAP